MCRRVSYTNGGRPSFMCRRVSYTNGGRPSFAFMCKMRPLHLTSDMQPSLEPTSRAEFLRRQEKKKYRSYHPLSQDTKMESFRSAAPAATAADQIPSDQNQNATEQQLNTRRVLLLSCPEDRQNLTSMSCLMRSQIEIFPATEEDVEARSRRGGRKGPISVGRIGIRCVHCRNEPERSRGAIMYPRSISLIYQAVRNFQRYHFKDCPHIPSNVLSEVSRLPSREHAKKNSAGYWVTSAKSRGLEDDISEKPENKSECRFGPGIRFRRGFNWGELCVAIPTVTPSTISSGNDSTSATANASRNNSMSAAATASSFADLSSSAETTGATMRNEVSRGLVGSDPYASPEVAESNYVDEFARFIDDKLLHVQHEGTPERLLLHPPISYSKTDNFQSDGITASTPNNPRRPSSPFGWSRKKILERVRLAHEVVVASNNLREFSPPLSLVATSNFSDNETGNLRRLGMELYSFFAGPSSPPVDDDRKISAIGSEDSYANHDAGQQKKRKVGDKNHLSEEGKDLIPLVSFGLPLSLSHMVDILLNGGTIDDLVGEGKRTVYESEKQIEAELQRMLVDPDSFLFDIDK